MAKILLFVLSISTLFASYNPFFQEDKPLKKQVHTFTQTKKVKTYKAKPKRKNIDISYFGFIHSNKGKFALINFQNQNIVIKKGDSLYTNEQIFKVSNITSNYIVVKDRYNRPQSIYFSSKASE